jgi:hypothetical protein
MTDEAQSGTNTADEQRKTATGKPFVKGDARINRKGRPKSFDQLRALAQKISHEPIQPGATMTAAEAILRQMAHDNPARFIEIAFGKVPDEVKAELKHSGEVTFRVIRDEPRIHDQTENTP